LPQLSDELFRRGNILDPDGADKETTILLHEHVPVQRIDGAQGKHPPGLKNPLGVISPFFSSRYPTLRRDRSYFPDRNFAPPAGFEFLNDPNGD
jgi:hypothetical protein